MDEKGATTFGDLKLGPRERSWDRAAADKRVRAWAGADEKPNAKYRRAFFWFDSEAADTFGAFKLLFADIIEGSLVAVPRAVFACAAAIQGARGGVDIPESDVPAVKAHIARYYAKMRREWEDETMQPPWKSKAAEGPGGLEYKSFPAEFKVDSERRIVECYTAVFGNVDDGGDVIERGAFEEELDSFGHRVKTCYQHDTRYGVIGKPVEMHEDSKGLFIASKISRTRLGDDVMVLIDDKVITDCSIGYNTLKYHVDEEEGIRHLDQVQLWENSYVTWGMNELATITGVKAGQYGLALRRFAAMQDEITGGRALTDQRFLSELIGALKALQEASPGHDGPPSPNGDAEALDPSVKAIATDLSAFVQRVKLGEELEEFAQSVR